MKLKATFYILSWYNNEDHILEWASVCRHRTSHSCEPLYKYNTCKDTMMMISGRNTLFLRPFPQKLKDVYPLTSQGNLCCRSGAQNTARSSVFCLQTCTNPQLDHCRICRNHIYSPLVVSSHLSTCDGHIPAYRYLKKAV